MKKEKIGQDIYIYIYIFFFSVRIEDWSFGGLVGNSTSASESVSKKTKQKNKK